MWVWLFPGGGCRGVVGCGGGGYEGCSGGFAGDCSCGVDDVEQAEIDMVAGSPWDYGEEDFVEWSGG